MKLIQYINKYILNYIYEREYNGFIHSYICPFIISDKTKLNINKIIYTINSMSKIILCHIKYIEHDHNIYIYLNTEKYDIGEYFYSITIIYDRILDDRINLLYYYNKTKEYMCTTCVSIKISEIDSLRYRMILY